MKRELMITIMKLRKRILPNLAGLAGRVQLYGNPVMNFMVDEIDDLATYEEAMMSPDSNKWLEAMKSEMESMYENQVWTLADLPHDRKAVENKWIFKRKTDD